MPTIHPFADVPDDIPIEWPIRWVAKADFCPDCGLLKEQHAAYPGERCPVVRMPRFEPLSQP